MPFWQCTCCIIGELNFKFCLIADYWIKIKLTHKSFITAEDMATTKWWLCIVIFPREKTITPTFAVPWFYIQISYRLRPRHMNFFSLFRYQSSSFVHITDSCCYFKTWHFREIENFLDIANRRMLSLQKIWRWILIVGYYVNYSDMKEKSFHLRQPNKMSRAHTLKICIFPIKTQS